MSRPTVAITFRDGSQNGGPYISHKRVMESGLNRSYEFIPLKVPIPRVLRTADGMMKFVNELKYINPSMVHFAGLQLEGYYVSVALRKAGIHNTLLAIHGSISEAIELSFWKRKILEYLEHKTIGNTKYCFAVSEYVATWPIVHSWNNFLGVAYNMIGRHAIKNTREAIRAELKIPNDAIVVISTGRIIKEKGYNLLLPVYEILKERNLESKLYFIVVGDGHYYSELATQISDKGYSNKIKLIGYREDVFDYLNASDIYWTGTQHETLGCSIIEACDASLPIVASNVGGIPEVVENGIGGYLVKATDIEGYATSIERLVLDKEKRISMGREASRNVKRKFTDEKIVSQLDFFYQKTLNQ